MVKRLRRRPLTAESGVRFPMRVPKETGTAMCLFFVYSAWGICASAQLPSTWYQKKQALQCTCFLFIQHGEFAPKRNFSQHGTKRNRHCNVPVFCLFGMGNLRPSATSHNTATKVDRHCNVPVFCLFGMGNLRPSATSLNTVPKETGTAMCLFFVAMRGESERGIERRVKKTACGQAELFVRICVFAPSLDLGKRRTRVGGFAEGRKRARGQPARHTRAFVY